MTKESGQKHPSGKSYEAELSTSIEELESLIADKAKVTINTHPAIPVLDEAIDPEDFYEEDVPASSALYETTEDEADDSISREQLTNMIESMEQKLTGELDALVTILKDAIKDSIMTEIKSQLDDNRTLKPDPANPEGAGQPE